MRKTATDGGSTFPGAGFWLRGSVGLLIGLQVLLAVIVISAIWFGSQHLREVALGHMDKHAQVQTHNLEDRLTQSFELLQAHLRAMVVEQPHLFAAESSLYSSLESIQQKLPYIRSLSIADRAGRIRFSTQAENIDLNLTLEPMLPVVAANTPDILRFASPWFGRDFADGARWGLGGDVGNAPESSMPVFDAGFFPVTMVLPEAPEWTVVVAINSDYFINLALSHRVSQPLSQRVFNDQGILLFSTDENDRPGSILAESRLGNILSRQVGTSTWQQADGKGLLVAFRASRNYPWFVQSQASTEEVLLDWRNSTHSLWLITAATMALVLLCTGYLTWRVHRALQQEARLREENRLAASVFTHTSDLIIITDQDGLIVTVNPSFERTTGFSAAEAQGKRPGHLSPDQQELETFAKVWAGLAEHGCWQGEIIEPRKDGSDLPGWLSVNAVYNSAGQVINYVGVLRDLTRLRADEATIRQLSNAVEQSPSSIVITSTEPRIEYANPEFFRATGYQREEVIGANPRILQSGLTAPKIYREMWASLKAGRVWRGEFVNRRKDGSHYVESASVAPLMDAAGRTTHYLGIKHDITAQKESEKSLRLAASVITNTHDGVMICDAQQQIVEVNPAFVNITGYEATDVIGQHPIMLSAGQKNQAVQEALAQALQERDHWQGEFWNRRKDGRLYAAFSTINAIRDEDGELSHYISVFSDITERKNHESALESLAHYDPLTNLPNRTLLADRLQQAIAHARRRQQYLAVGFIDLDGFKAVNDTHGHEAGDELLLTIAQRLEQHIRAGDTVARLGGDEFVILLGGLQTPAHCLPTAQRLLQAISVPVLVRGACTVEVSGSLGLSIYPDDAADGATLMRYADQAMYQAKQGGRNRFVLHGEHVDHHTG
ncbi:MAG: PAS domain S-box protein [Thauera sp.]|nr:PAS domain S-box protein [Thauera sp.]